MSFTAGADLGFRQSYGLSPSIEVRGTIPLIEGHVDNQRNIMAGLKLAKTYGRFSPYGDFLFGHGEIRYNGYYANPAGTFGYSRNSSNILSPGLGVDIRLTRSLDAKVDAQFQRYSTPVTNSGHLYAKPITIGVVYHIFRDAGPR